MIFVRLVGMWGSAGELAEIVDSRLRRNEEEVLLSRLRGNDGWGRGQTLFLALDHVNSRSERITRAMCGIKRKSTTKTDFSLRSKAAN